jgi:RNA polymerase sigma-70 factor (ECF subfamily)
MYESTDAGVAPSNVFAQHIRLLYSRALKLTKDRDLADDLVQDTLLTAYAKAHLFDGQYPGAWLLKIQLNLFLTGVKSRRRYQRRFIPLAEEAESSDLPPRYPTSSLVVAPDQETRVECAELLEKVDDLSQTYRAAFILVCLRDYSYAEAASALRIPEGTVKSRVNRAREELRSAVA